MVLLKFIEQEPLSKEREGVSHHTYLHRFDKREVVMAISVGIKERICWRSTSGRQLIESTTAPFTLLRRKPPPPLRWLRTLLAVATDTCSGGALVRHIL